MNRYSLTIWTFSMLLSVAGLSQTLLLPSNGSVILKEVKTDTVYYVPIKILERPKTPFKIHMKDSDLPAASAAKGKDYDYVEGDLASRTITTEAPDYFSIGIIVKARGIKRDTIRFELKFSFGTDPDNPVQQTLKGIILPVNPANPVISLPDTSKWSVNVITGGNFDFFDAPTFKNFAGDISVWTPDLFQWTSRPTKKRSLRREKKGKSPIAPSTQSLGLHVGFFNYRYSESDTSKNTLY